MADGQPIGFAWFHRLSLRAGLIIGFIAVVALTLLVAAVALFVQERFVDAVNKLLEVDGRIAALTMSSNVAMLKARRAEKDFFQFRREFGFEEARSRYVTLLRTRLAEVRQYMGEIRELTGEREFIQPTLEIERAIAPYESGFGRVVDLYEQLGQVNTGLEQEMREKAHEMESIIGRAQDVQLLADLLSLRRHEKDFIARGLDKYAEAFAKGVEQFKTDLAGAHLATGRKDELADLVEEYLGLFRRYVETDTRIDAESAAYLAAVHEIEPMLENLHFAARQREIAVRNDAVRTAQIAARTISAVALTALLVGATVAWLIARTIGVSLARCLDFAVRVGGGDWTARLLAEGRNEFAALAAALNRMTEALQEREAGLRRAQRIAKLSHVITGPDGSFERWSDSLPQMIGLDESGMPRSTREWLNILHPDDRAMFRGKCIEAGTSGMRTEVEYRLRRADGSFIHVRQVMDPLEGVAEGNGKKRWFNTLQDATESKAQQERLERLNRVHAVLSGVNALLIRVRDRDELFREACRVAVEAGGFRMAWVGVVDHEAGLVEPVAWLGGDEGYIRSIPRRINETDPEKQSLTIRAVKERKPMVADDITTDARVVLKEESVKRGLHSLAILPLLLAGKAVAVLALYAGEIGFFDEEEMTLLNELAGDVSFALDHIEKGEQLERSNERIRRLNRTYAVISGINAAIVRIRDRAELLRETCRIAVEAGRHSFVWIGLVDRAAMRVVPVAWYGLELGFLDLIRDRLSLREEAADGQSIVVQAVRAKNAVISNDVRNDPQIRFKKEHEERGFLSIAAFPLLISGEAQGILTLQSRELGFFDDEETKLLLELAGDIAFAMDHLEKGQRLDYLAYYDSLTGLANRGLLLERLNQQIHAARQAQNKVGLALADIERLRTINESLGRQAGDALLKQAAGRLTRAADATEIGRIGADQFAVLFPSVKGKSGVVRGIGKLSRSCFGESFRLNDKEVRVSAKAGIALFPNDGDDAETLLRNAEAALRKAKQSGERYVFYSRKMTERAAERLTLENRLRQALEKDEFVLHYQPKLELETRRIAGAEALIRWQNPELGLVPPGDFIPLMEETGLILEVGIWALSRAVADHLRWLEQGLPVPRLAVNVSAIQLRRQDFFSSVENAIKRGATPPGIDLEITESLVMEDIESNIAKLKQVRGLGVNIAIDDFGTGYSSLGYLAKLPVQSLKIDRSFIVTMVDDPDTATLVRTIISLAHSLRLKVVAEGVDSQDQARFLRLLRCDEMQGFLFSRPLPFEAMTALLSGERG